MREQPQSIRERAGCRLDTLRPCGERAAGFACHPRPRSAVGQVNCTKLVAQLPHLVGLLAPQLGVGLVLLPAEGGGRPACTASGFAKLLATRRRRPAPTEWCPVSRPVAAEGSGHARVALPRARRSSLPGSRVEARRSSRPQHRRDRQRILAKRERRSSTFGAQ